jgi:hypothetical protein
MRVSRRHALKLLGASLPMANSLAVLAAVDSQAADSHAFEPHADDWPWWRGPDWNAHATGEVPPLKWSETNNVRWKTPVEGRGHATPCLWGDRIFLSTSDELRQTQSVICLRRSDGRTLWKRQVHSGGFPPKHEKNSHASATPACDGRRVYVVFHCQGAVLASALDLAGEVLWQKDVGPYDERYGYGSSPAIYDGALIVAGDSKAAGFLAALDHTTGREIWRAERPNLPSYGAPIIATLGGRRQILVQGNRVAGYDPATGEQLWHCAAPARATACSLCCDGRRVYASGGYPERRIWSIRGEGEGDVTESHIEWRFERKGFASYVPSPLLARKRLFVVSDGGLAACLNADDGQPLWSERLGGDCSASPVLIGDYLIAPNETGRTYVLRAGDTFELVAENTLEEGAFASPVVCGGRLYLRTTGHLYCIHSQA